jgi:hypothetical protein
VAGFATSEGAFDDFKTDDAGFRHDKSDPCPRARAGTGSEGTPGYSYPYDR